MLVVPSDRVATFRSPSVASVTASSRDCGASPAAGKATDDRGHFLIGEVVGLQTAATSLDLEQTDQVVDRLEFTINSALQFGKRSLSSSPSRIQPIASSIVQPSRHLRMISGFGSESVDLVDLLGAGVVPIHEWNQSPP